MNGSKVIEDCEVLEIMIDNKQVIGVKTNKGDILTLIIITPLNI